MTKIAILEYSLYGHINQLSRSIKKEIESVGVEVEHLRCAETLPSEVLEQMRKSMEDLLGEVGPMPDRMVRGSLPPWNCPLPRIMEDTLPN